ncbi:MAG: PAS domain-containing protein [Rickettsiaceae bacterium]|nr:PAS domain-containing protein [Rickettsiaceae bacterium]
MKKDKIEKSVLQQISTDQMLMGASSHMYWKDREGRMLGCNLLQAKALGYDSVEDVVGKTDFDLFDTETAKALRENDEKVISTGMPLVTKEIGKIGDNLRAFVSHKTPIRDEEGNVVGVFGMSMDVTEQKEFGVTIPGRVYKARLNYIPKDDAEFLKARNCVIPLSMGNDECHFEKLRATLKAVSLRYKECTVVVCDRIYRHTLASEYLNKTPQELDGMAIEIGDKLIESHENIFKDIKIPHQITRWAQYIDNKTFSDNLDKVLALYKTDPKYKELADIDSTQFLMRRDAKDCQNSFENAMKYLFEETAVMADWKCFDYMIYPSQKKLESLLYAISVITPEISQEKWRAWVDFKAVDRLDNQDLLSSLPLYKIVENMPGHIYWKDKYGTVLGSNREQAKALGYKTVEEVIGKTEFNFWSEDVAMNVRKNDLEVMQSRKPLLVEEFAQFGGERRAFISYKAPLLNSHTAVVGIVGVSIDVTKQKELEAELKIKNDALRDALQGRDEFLRNMTHEIKTPLACILKMSSMLYENWDDYKDNDSRKAHLKVAVDGNRRLKGVLFNIMDLSKSQAGKMVYEKECYSLKDAAINVVDEFIDERHKIKVIVGEGNFYGCFDHYRIEQVIRNLVSNAFRYGGDGIITVKLTEANGVVYFSISDEGVGIPEAELEKIFEIFTQSSRTKTSAGGTGIGLSICRNIIAAHDGKIWVENNPDGRGCTFSFCIPAVDVIVQSKPKLQAAQRKVRNPQDVAKKSLALVIDDDDDVLQMTALILESIGFDVITAASGMDGLEKLYENKDKIDVVLLDVMIPDVYGLEILKRIRASQELKHLEVYIHSSVSEGDVVLAEAADIGISGVIDKMMSAQDIERVLSKFL